MNYQTKYKQIPLETSIHLKYLHQDKGLTVPELCKRYLSAQKQVYIDMQKVYKTNPIGSQA